MSAISLKSITGITSITTPAGVDNQLTLHTNNTTERVKIDVAGNVHINNQLAVAGITSISSHVHIPQGKDIKFGNNYNSPGLFLSYDGSVGRIQAPSTGIFLGGPVVSLKSGGLNERMLEAVHNGAVTLYYDSSNHSTAKLATTATGVTIDGTAVAGGLDISGDIDVDGHTNLDHVSIAGITTFTNGFIDFKPGNGGNAHFRILSTGSGEAGIFFDAANGDIAGSDYVFIGQKNNLDFVINPNANAGNIDFQRAGTTQLRIDTSGRTLFSRGGLTASRNVGTKTGEIQVANSGNSSAITIIGYSNDVGGPHLVFGKSRAGNATGSTILQSGDRLGEIAFCGADGTDIDSFGAAIKAHVDGTPGANDMPGRLEFYTTGDGGSSAVERLRIDSNGDMALGGAPITSGYKSFTIHEPGTASGSHVRFNMTTGNTGNTGSDGFSITVNAQTNNIHYIQREAADMAFQNTGGRRFTIKSDGKIGIGDFSSINPARTLHLHESSANTAIYATFTNGSTGTAASNGFTLGIDSSQAAIFNNYSNTDIVTICNGSERLRIKSDGKVGINQASPRTTLDVNGYVFLGNGHQIQITGSSGAKGLQLIGQDDGTSLIGTMGSSGEHLLFRTASNERMRLLVGGPHLLLGGTSSVNEITESSAHAGMVIGGTGFGNAGLAIISSTSGTGRLYFGDSVGGNAARNRGQINYYHNGDYMLFATAGSERLRITSDGKVGINVTNPQALLDVGGNVDGNVQASFTRANDPNFRIQFRNESSSNNVGESQGKFGLFYASNSADICGMQFLRGGSTGAGSLTFTTGGTERARITSAGQLAIRNTGTSSQAANLIVFGDADNTDAAIFSGGDWNRGLKLSFSANNSQNDQNVIYNAQGDNGQHIFATGGNYVGRFEHDQSGFISENTASGDGDTECAAALQNDYSSWAVIYKNDWIGNNSGWGTFWAGNGGAAYRRVSSDSNPNEHVMVGSGNKRFTFDLDSGGNAYFDGSLSQNNYDYAEYFEWEDGNPSNEDRRGYSVFVNSNGKIEKATDSTNATDIIGVISGTAAVIGDGAIYDWQGKWKVDEWGTVVTEVVKQVSWKDDEGKRHSYEEDKVPSGITIPSDASYRQHKRRILNTDYDDSKEYVPRDMRQEWDPVGLLGKVRVRDDSPKNPNWKFIKIVDGKKLWLIR